MDMKIQSFAFVLLMIMLFSNVVSGQDGLDLLIGGIGQNKEDQKNIQEFADSIGAKYVPTYLGDWFWVGLPAVEDATPNYLGQLKKDTNSPGGYISTVEFDDFSQQAIKNYNPTLINGLSNPLLNNGIRYDTIYAHSGGTRTAVTALLYQKVSANTLVLISPIQGADFMDLGKYKWELTQLFLNKKVNHILIYQSPVDNLPLGKGFYQAKFDKDNPGIEGDVTVIELDQYEDLRGKKDYDAHVQMWYTALNLKLGRDPLSPTPKSLEDITSAADVADDFSRDTGLWSYSGNAYRDAQNGYIALTPNNDLQVGNIWLNQDIASPFTIEFRYKAGGGTGADGLTLMFYKDKNYEPGKGGWMGFNPETGEVAPGYGIEFDNYENSDFSDPIERHIALIKDSVVNHLRSAGDQRTEDNQWHQVKVEVNTLSIVAYVDGDQVINFEGDILKNYGGLGFSAATWSYNNWHLIDDVRIST
jgi:hypothetical protein